MKKLFIFLFILISISSISNGLAQTNNSTKYVGQLTEISVDTGGKTGSLTYEEGYYAKNETGVLVFDQSRMFFNGTINQSTVKFRILRPLKDGKPYPLVRAVAMLDNKIIINGWYKASVNNISANNTNNTDDNNTGKKSPGFEIIVVLAMISMVFILRKQRGD